jgi:cytochrome c biogenesis protein CcmG/thiol:disulfide interchange protein DsbE
MPPANSQMTLPVLSLQPGMRLQFTQRRAVRGWAVAVLAMAALLSAGCGDSTTTGDYGGGHPDYATALHGAPKPLASLYEQANDLKGGGVEAFDAGISSLHGYPVVVNAWASWCGPCREEFPLFQQASAKLGKRVGFLGVDSQDASDAAKQFLSEFPVPYPSYQDPDQKIAESFDARFGLPATAFYDANGQLVYTKQGPYTSLADLEADIKRYGG